MEQPNPAVVNQPEAQTPTPAPVPGGFTTDITSVMQTPNAGGAQPAVQPAQPGQQDAEGQPNADLPESIPYARFQEVITAKNELSEQVKTLQQQVQVMTQMFQNPQSTPQPTNAPVAAPVSRVDAVLKQFENEPYLNRDQVGTVLREMESGIRSDLASIQFFIEHPDYPQIVNRDPSSPLIQALDKNPGLAQLIKTSPNPQLTAYEIGKTFQTLQKSGGPAPVLPNPGPQPKPAVPTISQVGGRTAIGGRPNWNTMTEEQFAQERSRYRKPGPDI